ncbi:SPOSA6832_04545 [Sporobolomyces salmonicolor]|uniref:SPOSA6832_04545-mRNA-1:cds n=1 Tax=Sporidiobolus salmonicolor TaxID=5005 RepID=A0A0D6ET21_SPOSA|nr:SPOSA6832_04545 [Sporobolomyces salmonicolor]
MADPAPVPAPAPATPALAAHGAAPIPSSTAVSGSNPAAGGAGAQLCMNGCGKAADRKNTCPTCQSLNIPGAQFCSPECFRDNWKTHKQLHVKADPGKYQFPEGTKDAFDSRFKYTGPLRAVAPVEPVPKREVPAHIPRPDYATELNGVSFTEEVANRSERIGRILKPDEIEGMRKVCKLAREVLDIAASHVRPGITTLELDAIVHEECIKRNSYPSPLGYHKFPRSVCTSINEVICHGPFLPPFPPCTRRRRPTRESRIRALAGIPDARPLVDGDIINLDVTLYHGGFHGDINATYPVGSSTPQQSLDLIACARECLDEAIRLCKPGFQYQDLGKMIELIASRRGFSTNKTYCGHGINHLLPGRVAAAAGGHQTAPRNTEADSLTRAALRRLFHCAPNVPHYAGNRASGTMRVGQTFTIEPMICVGQQKEVHWPDNWTAATCDGKPSAQFEETLLVTADGVEVLTAAPGWTLPEKKSDAAQMMQQGQGGASKKGKKARK